MEKCDYCGEYKKVKELVYGELYSHWKVIYYFTHFINFPFDYICEDCDKAKKIMLDNKNKEEKERRSKIQKDWIKQRDKILNGR